MRAEAPEATAAPDGGGAAIPDPPLNRMIVAVLSLVGFFVSFYLLAYHMHWLGEIVCGVGDCATVQASDYATVGPVPLPAFGIAGYVILFGLAFLGIQPGQRRSRTIAAGLLVTATVGVAVSAWLTWIEAFVIEAWCQWCVVSAICMTLIFLASLPEIRRMREVP